MNKTVQITCPSCSSVNTVEVESTDLARLRLDIVDLAVRFCMVYKQDPMELAKNMEKWIVGEKP